MTGRSRALRVLPGLALAGLLGLTAACGGGSGSAGGGASASATATANQSTSASASASPSASSSAATGGGTFTKTDLFSRLLAAQKKAGSYSFTLTLGSAGQKITGTGDADTSTTPASSRVQLGLSGQQIQTISTGGIFYLKGGPFGTAKWLKIDPNDKTSQLGQLLGSLGSSDPTSALSALQQAAAVTKKGTAQVGGRSTTEYDVTVPGSALAAATKLSSQIQSLLPKEVTYQLFVSDDDLLRRLATSFAIQGQSSTTQIDFADYGKKVSIAAPPAAQTTTQFTPGG